jgi:hypothetical protein
MKWQFLVVPVVAFIAGLAGGWSSRFMKTEDLFELPSRQVVRAHRIELVDESGRTRAYIGSDGTSDAALVFVDDQKRERARFGLLHGPDVPMFEMRGWDDGGVRVGLYLTGVEDRPLVQFNDRERTRMNLGFRSGGDVPSPQDENWGIWFYGPQGEYESLARMGIERDRRTQKPQGFVSARGMGGTN